MRTTQRKGDIAKAKAISSFTAMGWDVWISITESASYDLIIDIPEGLKRVSVKYCSGTDVDLRSIHSNGQGYVVKKSKEGAYDWLYVYKPSGEEFLIKTCLAGRSGVRPKPEHLFIGD